MTIRPICEKDKSELIKIMTEFYSSPAVLAKPSKELFEKDIADCLSDMPFVEGYVAEAMGLLRVTQWFRKVIPPSEAGFAFK